MAEPFTLESARKYVSDTYESFKKSVGGADLNKDGKPDLQQFNAWLSKQTKEVQEQFKQAKQMGDAAEKEKQDATQTAPAKPDEAAKDASKEPTPAKPDDAAKEAPKDEPNFFKDNTGLLLGLLGGALVIASVGGWLGTLLLIGLALLGATMDGGKGSVLGAFFTPEAPAATPAASQPDAGQPAPGQAQAAAPDAAQQGSILINPNTSEVVPADQPPQQAARAPSKAIGNGKPAPMRELQEEDPGPQPISPKKDIAPPPPADGAPEKATPHKAVPTPILPPLPGEGSPVPVPKRRRPAPQLPRDTLRVDNEPQDMGVSPVTSVLSEGMQTALDTFKNPLAKPIAGAVLGGAGAAGVDIAQKLIPGEQGAPLRTPIDTNLAQKGTGTAKE